MSEPTSKLCSNCESVLVRLLPESYFPTGATGSGAWFFRKCSLYHCTECGQHFSVIGDVIRAPQHYKLACKDKSND